MPTITGDTTIVGILASIILALVGTQLWVVRSIISGGLVPRRTYEDTLTAVLKMQERADLQAEQLAKMADAIGTVKIFIESLPRTQDPVPGQQAQRRERR